MKKIVIIPSSKEMIDNYLESNINGFILPIEDLSVNSTCYFTINDVKELVKKTKKEIYISLNKTMANEDLPLLERTLKELNKLKINKVLFYDLAIPNICKSNNLTLELAVYQDHLNASINSNIFYRRRGIQTTVITNDITIDEINEIAEFQSLMMVCFGYLPIFYSRRYLITNYLEYINKKKKDSLYTIKEKDNEYIIEEEKYGTTVYTKEPINLINKIDKLNIDVIILNANHIDNQEFKKIVNQYLNRESNQKKYYEGFLEKKTVYKVEDYE